MQFDILLSKILTVLTFFLFTAVIFVHLYLFLGSTPLGCYKKLIEYYKKGEISFQYVKTFNMDEYVGMYFIFWGLL